MVERYRRAGRGKLKLLGNHQKCWVWGRHAVQETLRAGRWPIIALYLSGELGRDERERWSARAEELGTEVTIESPEQLGRRCRSAEHQGFVAKMSEFPYTAPDHVLRRPLTDDTLYLVCDGIQDPYNFGAILRTADALRSAAVLIPTQNQVGVTSLVARTSSGAVNHVSICRVAHLPEFLESLRAAGALVVAASEKAETPAWAVDFRQPTVLIIGNEGQGIQPSLLSLSDHLVTIPQQGSVSSLNAAVSAGILLYEIARQRSQHAHP